MPTYSELPRDPRWQKKRLERRVMAALAWACRNTQAQRLLARLHETHPAWCDSTDLSLAE